MDFDNQADKAWLLSVQRKLYRWSHETPEGAYGDVWNFRRPVPDAGCLSGERPSGERLV